jgi:DNA-binding transcriptional MerR regulator
MAGEAKAALKQMPTPAILAHQAQLRARFLVDSRTKTNDSTTTEPTVCLENVFKVMDACVSKRKNIACPVCVESFDLETRVPLMLPCLHVICRNCAVKQERESGPETGFNCFACNKPTETVTSDLQVDYTTTGLFENVTPPSVPNCHYCDESLATTFCGECASNNMLCAGCSVFAHKSVSRHGHTVMPIEEHLHSTACELPTLKCSHHPSLELKLFCRTCVALVCVECAAYVHRDHDFTSIEEEEATSKKMLESAAIPVVHEFSTLKDTLAQCRKMLEELDEHSRKGLANIEGIFKVVRQTWVQRKQTLTAELKAEVARKKRIVNEHIQQLEGQHDHTELGLGLAKRALDSTIPTQLLGMRRLTVVGLERLGQHCLTMKPTCTSTVRVDPTPAYTTLITTLSSLGTVVVDDSDDSTSENVAHLLEESRKRRRDEDPEDPHDVKRAK